MPVRAFATAATLPQEPTFCRKAPVRRGESDAAISSTSTGGSFFSLPGATFLPSQVVREIARRAGESGSQKGRRRPQAQHVYQTAAFCTQQAATPAAWVTSALTAGCYRLELEVPSRLRLARWQAKHLLFRMGQAVFPPLRRPHHWVRRVFPLAALLGATVACSLVKEGAQEGLDLGPMPELSKPKGAVLPEEAKNPKAPWHYVLPIDHGVRADASGEGNFRAPRFHGEHNGLDLLAPVGTPVFSPCEGKALAGVSQSFGRWVHVICPVPEQFVQAGTPHPWASFFYAHLDTADLPHNDWVSVAGSQTLGTVGKTGNARSPTIKPHLHLELIVQKNRRAAMDEHHIGSDQSSVPAADHFADVLSQECMNPYGFKPKSELLRRARRIDPFVALTCLSQRKPNFIKAPSPLAESSRAWTTYYVAKDFNVNLGVEDSRLARR